jgi:ribosomal protein S18 acetylase RimI-like enzyme
VLTMTLRRNRARTGVRPFDPYRDCKPVTELISVAFRGKLGPDGEMALAEMQRVARLGSLLWWVYWPAGGRSGVPPGFVWTERGRVVGNVSLRRAFEWGGFFIGNVAVHPDYRGRGIARTLIEKALDTISTWGGRWVGLDVRADNEIARQLYERLGFREVGRTLHMLRPAGLSWDGMTSPHPGLRRGQSHDSAALVELVQAVVPASQRPLLELRIEDYRPGWERTLSQWLEGRREAWWVIEEIGVVCGAVRALRQRGRRPNRLEVLVGPGRSGRFENTLVQRGMASLGGGGRKVVEAALSAPPESLIAAMEAAGFRRLHVLIQMRLDLGRRISVGA